MSYFEKVANEGICRNQEARKRKAERQAAIARYLAELDYENRIHRYEIKQERGHYVVLEDGEFYCSADTYGEAMREIPS